jgi:two-component system, OmpR family, sensor histidine kinase PrrB
LKPRRPLSIRSRVTIAATAAVGVVLIAGGVLTVASFASRERSSLDHELERRAQGPAGREPERPGFGDERPPPGGRPAAPPGLLAESGTFVRVISGGSVVESAGDVPSKGFPVPHGTGFETVDAGGHSWRTLTVSGGAEGTRVQFAADLRPVDDRIESMRTRVALISAVGVGLAAILASLLSGLALEPLSRLRRAVTGVSSTRDLSRRVPEEHAATEVNELAGSVNAMLGRLEVSAGETEHALEATRRFAADVGHELRTPLTSIRANLDAISRNPSMPEAERKAALDDVAREHRELVAVLDALQALARGDAGTALPRERLDLGEVVDAAVEAARRRHPEARIELVAAEEPQPLTGWPDGLRLLVDNLIENAVRHGGSQVRVGLGANSSDGSAGVVLSVEDDGPGIPDADRERIFDRFARGSAATAPGSGLGLALVAQQAALHGGGVEVANSPAGGARFVVRLPVER